MGNENMGMTNKQFQGFIRLALSLIKKAIEQSPENASLTLFLNSRKNKTHTTLLESRLHI